MHYSPENSGGKFILEFPSLGLPLTWWLSHIQRCSFEASLFVAIIVCILHLTTFWIQCINWYLQLKKKITLWFNFGDHNLQWPFISLVTVVCIKFFSPIALLLTQIVNLLQGLDFPPGFFWLVCSREGFLCNFLHTKNGFLFCVACFSEITVE